jgi:hypothetical protein
LVIQEMGCEARLGRRSCKASAATFVVALVLAAGAASGVAAEPRTPAGQNPAAPAAAAPQPALPSVEQILYLIRSTLLTLNDANRSGNYSVLRDLAGPDFQARNTAADLAQSFADLRRRNFDLFAVALLPPQLTAAPSINADRLLRLAGVFPTRPLQINFDLTFQVAAGQWRLFGIGVATPEAPPQAQAQTQTQTQTQSEASEADRGKPKLPAAAKNR